MKIYNLLLLGIIFLITGSINISARSLLEKPIYFINPQTGKIDSTKFWKMYLGKYNSVTLLRKFPGEDTLPIKADVNLTMLSSGYIEGYGYSQKGRVDCSAIFVIDTGTGPTKLLVDSIDYVFASGTKVKPRNGKICDLTIDIEGNKVGPIRNMLLTKYKLVVEYEERNLKPEGDVEITFFAFSKSGLAAAQKAEKETGK
jgi:hypothetical protein